MKTVAIIQARMSSTRLPGKVMMKIAGKPMLWYVVERTRWATSLDDVIVATSTDRADDVIVDFCKKNKINCFRGSLENVLSRYYHAAKEAKADVIVRITSDCPLIDGQLIDQGVSTFMKSRADYLSNILKRTFPRGFDFEIFTFEALEKAFKNARERPEREHVTPYIYHHPDKFKLKNFPKKQNKSRYRITVDTIEDFKVIKQLIKEYEADRKDYNKIINILDSHPELILINQTVFQKKYG